MSTLSQSFAISRGEDWARTYTWETGDVPNGVPVTPVNLTGATATFNVRTSTDPSTTPIYTNIPTLGNLAGTIAIAMTAAQTLAVPQGTYPIDVFITFATGAVVKFLSGVATFK